MGKKRAKKVDEVDELDPPTIEDLEVESDEDATVDDLVSALGELDERDPEGDGATDIADLVSDLGADPERTGEGEEGEGAEGDDGAMDLADVAADIAGDANASVEIVSELPIEADDDLRGIEGEASPRLVSILESLLFAATKPVTVRMFRRVLKDPSAHQIQLALKQLIADTQERGVQVKQVAGGFVLRTNAANAQWVQRMLRARPVRLSRPQLETLAVISYRQPATKAELDHIRGVDSGAVLRLLMDKDLVKVVGRKEEPGRPLLYGTTVFFLEFFNLMSLRDLPDLRDFRELSDGTKEMLRERLGEDEAEALGQEVLDFAATDGDSGETAQTADSGRTDSGPAEDSGQAEDSAQTEDSGQAEDSAQTEDSADAEEE